MSTVTAPRITTCFTLRNTLMGHNLILWQGGKRVGSKDFTTRAAALRYAEKNGYQPLPKGH